MNKDVQSLEPHAIIGFDGSALRGLKIHPEGNHIVYPMGNKVCIQEWKTKKMHFLSGHNNTVCTVAVSPKVRVEALVFTSDERYLVSLGGRDDGSVVLWDCLHNAATGTAQAVRNTTGDAMTLAPLTLRHTSFVTGGDSNLRVWNIRAESKNLDVQDVAMGKLRRLVRCLAVSKDDSYGLAGTSTGDIIMFSIKYPADPKASLVQCKPALIGCLAKCGALKRGKRPESVCYSQGVESILIMADGCVIVGAGDGTIDVLDEINWQGELPKGKLLEPNRPHFRALKTCKLNGTITSLELMESPQQQGERRVLLAGTRTSEIYAISVATFDPVLVVTCHRCAINDVAFPRGMSGVFATGGAGDIRVWCLESCQELLRVVVPNFTCSALLFSSDGKSIVSAWNDGNIRAFTPLTGRLMYCIFDTHNKGTSALAMTRDGRTLVSGGCEGQVRVWDVRPTGQSLKKVLKEHKSPVSAIQVSPNNTEAVSAGTDGSCIIWDLISLSRRQVMYANTLFMCVCFEPSGCQLLTGGTDRRVAYWETGSGNLARELVASNTGAINGLHISEDGSLFVTGGNDQMVKLWLYEQGIYTHVGLGHAAAVTCCRFSPDKRHVVSCCASGSVIVWKVPEQYVNLEPEPPAPASAEPAAVSPGELRLPLEEKAPKAGGDRPNKVPAGPSKVERISAMETDRESVHSCCPCENKPRPKGQAKPSPSGSRGSRGSQGSLRGRNNQAKPPDDLPTKTTSKQSVSGSGDRK